MTELILTLVIGENGAGKSTWCRLRASVNFILLTQGI